MEQLVIFGLFVLASVVSSYIQHKKKQEELRREADEAARGGAAPNRPAAEDRGAQSIPDWQEQLRRMLQGETEMPSPPVVRPQSLPRQTQPGKTPYQVPQRSQRPARPATLARSAPPVVVARTQSAPMPPLPVAPPFVFPTETSEGDAVFVSPLRQSAAAMRRAEDLGGKVDARLRAVGQQTQAHKPAAYATHDASAAATLTALQFRNPRTLRQAFIASLVFSPPPGLPQNPGQGG